VRAKEAIYGWLKKNLELEDLLEDLGVDGIDNRGDEIKCLCPFHDDTNPSFSINNTYDGDKWGLYSCWICKEDPTIRGVGNVVILVQQMMNIPTYKEAFNWLLNYLGGFNNEELMSITLENRLRSFVRREVKKVERVENASKIYSSMKPVMPDTKHWDFLLGRGVSERQIMTRGARMGRGRYEGRAVFPIFNVKNEVVSFSARSIGNKTPKVLHTKGKGTLAGTLFGIERVDYNHDWCYLLEGPFDVMTAERALETLGLNSGNVLGTNGPVLLEGQAKLLKQFENIVLVPDMKGKAKSIVPSSKRLLSGKKLYIVEVPRGKDPDDLGTIGLSKLIGNPRGAFDTFIIPVIDYTIRR